MSIIKPDDVAAFSSSDEIRKAKQDEMFARLLAMPKWTCKSCGEAQRHVDGNGSTCPRCLEKARAAANSTRPRQEVLIRAKVPDSLRRDPPWQESDWPTDPRSPDVHPAQTWPRWAAELVADREMGGPRSLLMRGCNGAGKSCRSADLVVSQHIGTERRAHDQPFYIISPRQVKIKVYCRTYL